MQLLQQADTLSRKGRFDEAIAKAERALSVLERTLGPEHGDVGAASNNLANLYHAKGDYAHARTLYQRALAIDEKALGREHPEVAAVLNNLGRLYKDTGDYARAEPLLQLALAINEKALGPEHPEVAVSLNNLAALSRARGDYARAEPLYQRALAINEKALGPEHPDVAVSLNNLAGLYLARGDYARAEPLYQRSLAIAEKVLGPEHPGVAATANNLAELYRARGDYARAEPLYQRALAINEKALGPVHPDVASALTNLAGLYLARGDYAQAEPLYQRALAINERALGPAHPSLGVTLNNLAGLYLARGDYARAEPLYQRALAIAEKALGPEHPDVAAVLDNLGRLYKDTGDYARAEPLYQRALVIDEKTLGPEHPDVASALNNLAGLYKDNGDYVRAEPLYQRALAIDEKALGPEHPGVAVSLNNLAGLCLARGDFARAEPLFQRALTIDEKVLGPEHADLATTLDNLAVLHAAMGDTTKALVFLSRGLEIEERNLELILATGSEAQKRLYLATLPTDAVISLCLRAAPSHVAAARLAITTVLRRKGRVLDAVSKEVDALRNRLGPHSRAVLDSLSATRTELATLVLRGPGKMAPSDYRQRESVLSARAERLEQAVASGSAEFRVQAQTVTLDSVQTRIPEGAALVELVSYRPYDPGAVAGARWPRDRYAACVLLSKGEPTWADLGEAASIDHLVQRLRGALGEEKPDARKLARALDRLTMARVRKLLGKTYMILLAPDAALNLIPFQALVDEHGRYLVERYTFTYLTSGRDLLRQRPEGSIAAAPVVMAAPDFEAAGGGIAAAAEDEANRHRRSAGLESVRFGPLPGTAEEARALGALLNGAEVDMGAQSTEGRLKQLHSPWLLHVATHGFFLKDQPDTLSAGREFGIGKADVRLRSENPLLRSGLALAGANRRESGADDGILTALEVSGMDLTWTELVVLSACETGVGEVRNGDGVYGLRRALVIAGAQSEVMSLWKVDDDATRDLMVAYYRRLLRGEGRSEALRAVQLEMLRGGRLERASGASAGRSHPFYWASFILSGDWRPLTTTAKRTSAR